MAHSRKAQGPARDAQITEGLARQERIRGLLRLLSDTTDGEVVRNRELFTSLIRDTARDAKLRPSAADMKVILAAVGESDPHAEICRDRHGNPEPDPELRDTEIIPLTEEVDSYIAREVLPHAPDTWVDENKTKIGYEIPLTRHFYVYEPPRQLEDIELDIQELEREIACLLAEVTA